MDPVAHDYNQGQHMVRHGTKRKRDQTGLDNGLPAGLSFMIPFSVPFIPGKIGDVRENSSPYHNKLRALARDVVTLRIPIPIHLDAVQYVACFDTIMADGLSAHLKASQELSAGFQKLTMALAQKQVATPGEHDVRLDDWLDAYCVGLRLNVHKNVLLAFEAAIIPIPLSEIGYRMSPTFPQLITWDCIEQLAKDCDPTDRVYEYAIKTFSMQSALLPRDIWNPITGIPVGKFVLDADLRTDLLSQLIRLLGAMLCQRSTFGAERVKLNEAAHTAIVENAADGKSAAESRSDF